MGPGTSIIQVLLVYMVLPTSRLKTLKCECLMIWECIAWIVPKDTSFVLCLIHTVSAKNIGATLGRFIIVAHNIFNDSIPLSIFKLWNSYPPWYKHKSYFFSRTTVPRSAASSSDKVTYNATLSALAQGKPLVFCLPLVMMVLLRSICHRWEKKTVVGWVAQRIRGKPSILRL